MAQPCWTRKLRGNTFEVGIQREHVKDEMVRSLLGNPPSSAPTQTLSPTLAPFPMDRPTSPPTFEMKRNVEEHSTGNSMVAYIALGFIVFLVALTVFGCGGAARKNDEVPPPPPPCKTPPWDTGHRKRGSTMETRNQRQADNRRRLDTFAITGYRLKAFESVEEHIRVASKVASPLEVKGEKIVTASKADGGKANSNKAQVRQEHVFFSVAEEAEKIGDEAVQTQLPKGGGNNASKPVLGEVRFDANEEFAFASHMELTPLKLPSGGTNLKTRLTVNSREGMRELRRASVKAAKTGVLAARVRARRKASPPPPPSWQVLPKDAKPKFRWADQRSRGGMSLDKGKRGRK